MGRAAAGTRSSSRPCGCDDAATGGRCCVSELRGALPRGEDPPAPAIAAREDPGPLLGAGLVLAARAEKADPVSVSIDDDELERHGGMARVRRFK